MKKILVLCVVSALLLPMLAGCAADLPGTPEPPDTIETPAVTPDTLPELPAPEEPETFVTFVDSADREIQVPRPLTRIFAGDLQAQSLLFSLAPELLCGWFKAPEAGGPVNLLETYRALPMYNINGAADIAAAKRDGAQALLLMASDTDIAELDAMAGQAGIPVIYIEADIDTLAQAYQMLGGLLGEEERAEEYADYVAYTLSDLADKRAAIGQRKHVYIASGADGLTPVVSNLAALIGAIGEPEGTDQAITFEQLEKLPLSAVIAADERAYTLIAASTQWGELEYIQLGLYYKCPELLFESLHRDAPLVM